MSHRDAKDRYRASAKGKATEARYRSEYVKRPDYKERMRAHAFKLHHGVTREEADRMIRAQGGRCAICGELPQGRGHCSRLHVDHCAETGRVRGMLCQACNRGLGFLRHNPARLRAAAAYLESLR